MTAHTLILPFTKPPDGLSGNSRAHWAVRNRSTQQVRDIVCAWGEREIEPMARMQVELVWVVKDARTRDSDNLWPLLKAVCDGLGSNKGTSARLVADDSPEHMVKLAPRIELQRGATPHFEVTVTEPNKENQ